MLHLTPRKEEEMASDLDQAPLWKNPSQIPYHTRQFAKPYRSTVHLVQFMKPLIAGGGEALDVACGAGANIFHLSQMIPGYRWTGLDIAGELLFSIGHQHFSNFQNDVTLVEGDFNKLTNIFPGRKFDLVLSMQTLSWLPMYEKALDQLLAVTRGWLFITSLFTEFDVDIKGEAIDYSEPITSQVPYHYHVFNLARFQVYCETRGCQKFVSQDFNIDIDLPQQSKGLGTYTQMLNNGKRLQFTGPINLPWRFVGIKMGKD